MPDEGEVPQPIPEQNVSGQVEFRNRQVRKTDIAKYGPSPGCPKSQRPDNTWLSHTEGCRRRMCELTMKAAEEGVAAAKARIRREEQRQDRINDELARIETIWSEGVRQQHEEHDRAVGRRRRRSGQASCDPDIPPSAGASAGGDRGPTPEPSRPASTPSMPSSVPPSPAQGPVLPPQLLLVTIGLYQQVGRSEKVYPAVVITTSMKELLEGCPYQWGNPISYGKRKPDDYPDDEPRERRSGDPGPVGSGSSGISVLLAANVDVSEAYSPPRCCAAAHEFRLTAVISFGVACCDELGNHRDLS